MERRGFLRGLGVVGIGAAAGGGTGYAIAAATGPGRDPVDATRAKVTDMEHELSRARRHIRQLSFNTASGGGVNLKRMPNTATGEVTVPMHEVFSFDRTHALCRVDTNPEAFVMPTHEMGEVEIAPHQFFMAMEATSIEQYQITTADDGARHATLRGGLDCRTEVGQAETVLGDRHAAEHATYRVNAVDADGDGDEFRFTVFFDPEEAPVNHDIFGPEFTFTGELIAGNITIIDPAALV